MIRKRWLSLLLSLCLIVGLFPLSAAAAGDAFQVGASSAKAGDSLTVSFTQPTSLTVSTVSLTIAFDRETFEITDIAPAPFANTQPDKDGSNSRGWISIGYTDSTYDANTSLAAGTVLLSATFRVRDGTTPGDKVFAVTDYAIGGAYDALTYSMTDITPGDAAVGEKTKTVSAYTELTSPAVAVAAPVRGAVPQAAVAETAAYTGAISWSGSPAVFAPKTVYTASVTLTAKPGYRFAAAATPVVGTASSLKNVVVASDGGTLRFDALFPATEDRILTGITVTKAPSKTAYEHGDTLDTAGMTVTATYDDSTSAPVTGYTVSYAGGSCLKKGNTAATVSYGGKTAAVTGLTVSAKALTVTGLTAKSRAYDGTKTVTLSGGTLSGVVAGETVTGTFPKTGTLSNANAGSGKAVTFTPVTLSGADAGNYTVTQPTVKANISKADPTAAFFDITLPALKVYDGQPADLTPPALKAAYASAGLEVALYCDGVKADPAPSDAGSYTVTFDVPNGGENFNSADTKMPVGDLTISAKDVTITGLTAKSKAYDGTADADAAGIAAVSGLVGSDDVTVTTGTAAFANPYVGTGKTVTFSGYSLGGSAAGNYNLTAQPAAASANITAAKQTPTVTASASLARGGNKLDLAPLVSNAEGKVSFSVKSGTAATLSGTTLTSSDSTGDVRVTVHIAAKDVNGDGTAEYSAYTGDGVITVHIVDKGDAGVTIAGVSSVTKTYGDAAFALTASASKPGGSGVWTWTSGDPSVASVDGSGHVTVVGAGSTTVTAAYESGTTIGEAAVTLTVAQREAALTWKNTSFVYDGKQHVPTATVTNTVNGDACTVTVTGGKTDAGSYTATATALSNANYKLPASGLTRSFTISKAASGVETAPTAKTGLTYNGNARELVSAGTAAGGTMVYSLTSGGTFSKTIPTGKNAGSYTVYYKVQGDSNHTDTAEASVTVSIAKAADPAALTVTAAGVKAGGSRDLSGFVSGAVGKVSYTVTTALSGCSVNASGLFTAGTTPGTCVVTVKVAGSTNYNAATLGTITVTVSAKDASVSGALSGNRLTYTVEAAPAGARLIAARYDGGRMTYVKVLTDPKDTDTIAMGGSGGDYKLILLDSAGRPVCDAWSISV